MKLHLEKLFPAPKVVLGGLGVAGVFTASWLFAPESVRQASAQEVVEVEEVEEPEAEEPAEAPLTGPLDSIPVPLPPNLRDYVKNKKAAILLGKSLFWDMQVGSDAKVACATCHFHAGADHRTKNTVAPNGGDFRGANYQLTAADYPFHRLQDPNKKRGSDNPVVFDTSEITGSQGVIKRDFVDIVDGSALDDGVTVPDPVFNIDGVNARQVTGRNTPTAINAIFNDRNFWDGRANRFFNGVNPFGDMDPDAKIWVAGDFDPNLWSINKKGKFKKGKQPKSKDKSLRQVGILLDNGSTASQAVGPPLSDVEMSWLGRSFPDVGRKMLQLTPLALQKVHCDDSVLGRYANQDGQGLKPNLKYSTLIKEAFSKRFWKSDEITPDGYTLMEQNFSLFWGLSIMLYESTLVSDDTPFDRWIKGDKSALSESAKEGFEIFTNQGKCINCHSGPEFTGAAISQLRGVLAAPDEPLIEFMQMQIGPEAFYDGGFYNIGARPTQEDLGVGGRHPVLGPWSLARRVQEGQSPDLNGQDISIGPNDRLAVDGAFKTPGLRNVELTGPYMHNGGMRTLEEVVLFYARRADFFEENIDDLDPDVDGIGHVRGKQERVQALVDFMKALTDERVRRRCAPFDHPELIITNGHTGTDGGVAIDDDIVIEAVGRDGGEPLKSFEETVQ
jgi:cytochrome c peroxidase